MRIASLQPSIALTLAHLDRLDALCSVTKYCLAAVPALASLHLPTLPDSFSFDRAPSALATLRAARPDLVIASIPYRPESLAAILQSGIPTLALAPRTLADIFADTRLMARLLDALPAAEALIHSFQQTLAATRTATASLPRQSVYCEEWGRPLIHSQPWIAELIAAANGEFIGIPGAPTSPAAIAALDPDVLLFAWCGVGNRVPLRRVIQMRQWQYLRAVRNRRVYCIPDEYLNTPSFNLLEGLACITAALHPAASIPHPLLKRLGP